MKVRTSLVTRLPASSVTTAYQRIAVTGSSSLTSTSAVPGPVSATGFPSETSAVLAKLNDFVVRVRVEVPPRSSPMTKLSASAWWYSPRSPVICQSP